jgi:dTDP-4-dehydrorhamnose 3,5-epimerase
MKKHVDERGFFQELLREDLEDFKDFAVKQVSWFSIEPGQERGGHYHKNQIEKFVVLEGTVTVRVEDVVLGKVFHHHHLSDGMLIEMTPYFKHTFMSEKGAKILVLTNRLFNPDDTDTYTKFA